MKYLLLVLVTFLTITGTGCTVNYTTAELNEKVKQEFPNNFEVNEWGVQNYTVSNPQVKLDSIENRIHFSSDINVVYLGVELNGTAHISGEPIIKNDTIFYDDIRFEKIDLSFLPNWIETKLANFILSDFNEYPIIPLSGLKKSLVKDIYLFSNDEKRILRIKWGIF